jgi:hypothetical protein
MPFLSLLDDRDKPKGSRDPLGFELVWTHFGRKVIGNLTTITASLESFTIGLLGFAWANRNADKVGNGEKERNRAIREYFLRYEQVASYLRYANGSEDIMGITRVRARMDDPDAIIRVGLGPDQMILTDQASYGMWGYYSSAMRDSDLVEGNDRVPTAIGLEIVALIEADLGATAGRIIDLISSSGVVDKDKLKRLAPGFMRAIGQEAVRSRMLDILMAGRDPAGLQSELWSITQEIFKKKRGQPETPQAFVEAVQNHSPSPALRQALDDIFSVERVLVSANNLFRYCRRNDGERTGTVLGKIKNRYRYAFLPKALPKEKFPYREGVARILDAFRTGNDTHALEALLALNRDVMKQRGGAPWVERDPDDRLRVKIKTERAQLASQADLEQSWDYDYFLGSYLAMARRQLAAA